MQLAAALAPEARGVQPEKCGRVDCGGWSVASVFYLNERVGYFRRISGRPYEGLGPGNCGRVSCSWNAAIW